MREPEVLVRAVRRRLRVSRALAAFERQALPASAGLLSIALGLRLSGVAVPPGRLLALGVVLLLLLATVAFLRVRVSLAVAAAETDRVLGARERISTAFALSRGRADDPLGFGPGIEAEAGRAARAAGPARLRIAFPIRPRTWSAATLACLLALLLVPLVPVAAGETPAAGETEVTRREKERVREALRQLDRKVTRTEELAKERKLAELERLAARIRRETAALRDQDPSRSKALARMADLEREARAEARRFAGLPPSQADDSVAAADQELRELREAIRNFESTDPGEVARRFTALMQKIEQGGLEGLAPGEMAELARQVDALRAAMEALAGRMGGDPDGANPQGGVPGGPNPLGQNLTADQMRRMAQAMGALAKALEKGSLDPSSLPGMADDLRSYRDLQLSPEQIEQMIRNLEELAKMIEAGEDISACRGGMGGMLPLPGAGGISLPGGLPGSGSGDGTGGSGAGRGGDPGRAADGTATRPELHPGQVGDQGTATLLRTVRRLPSPDDAPGEYGELVREANREAEEAIRRGDVPRRYRDAVRRFFSSPEDR